MLRSVRFAVLLVVALGALALVAQRAVDATTRGWFEHDVELRSDLVVSVARQALVTHWDHDQATVHAMLEDIARDERILAAAACSADGKLITETEDVPPGVSCESLARWMRPAAPDGAWSERSEVAELTGGPVHLSAVPVADGSHTLGFVVLVHDLTFVQRREEATRNFILIAYFVLAIAAAAVTLIAGRLSWRNWTAELRRLLRGEIQRPEFKPLLRDVRELIERFNAEKEDFTQGAWTPARLRQTLERNLRGEKVLIVANREPYIHERSSDGKVKVVHPASGLVTALEPVMRACSGTWIAHGSGVADRETSDKNGRLRVPPGEESYLLRRVWLTRAEEQGYYYGLANEGLWPLCHIADARPTFRLDDWQNYVTVNKRFAEAVCQEADSDDPIVLVQDYHFALVPRMIRERLPKATVLTFWHVPWPNSERFGICPWRAEILHGLLGSSIIGFHTQLHCNNFFDAVDRQLEARIDRELNAVVYGGQASLVRPYPISIEWPNHLAASAPPVSECRAQVTEELNLPADALIGIGVDRLDYTKGIEERLLAVERLLDREPRFRGRFTFIQLAAPSRTVIERYRRLNQTVEELAERINARFGSSGYRPIVLLRAHHEPPAVFKYLRAADVCYISSLHDGMNLVAKEFVAARDDERGVLVLSHFTGAARELTEALIVNPYDLDQASAALATALTMPAEEQRERMHFMRTLISEFNVYRWAGRMLVDAAKLRERERLSGRIADSLLRAGAA